MSENSPKSFLQSAAIPYLLSEAGIEVVLITNGKRTSWIYPKGNVEPDMTAPESAAQEALEEAGVTGQISNTLLTTYWYKKWGGDCRVEVFPLEVTEVLDHWDEKGYRDRKIVDIDTALSIVKDEQRVGIEQLVEFVDSVS